jgi:multiple sugar transport system substrate-binding protein
MADARSTQINRRALIAGAGAAALPTLLPWTADSQAAGLVKLTCWSAAVDQVKSHATAFEKATGVKVAYENFPWAQYRTSVVTRLVGNADLDVLWVSDAWLPEFAEAGWLASISDEPSLTKYNAEAAAYCTQSMTYKGKQYGLAYYGDHMSFLYNTEILQKAGIAGPPTTWDEVVQQSLKIKQASGPESPLLLSLATDTWLIEFISALVFSHGGRFVDEEGEATMADAGKGAVEAASFVRDAIHRHKIVSPSAVETTEINGLKAIGSGQFAFGIVPTYRLRALNDPSQATAAGKIRPGLMPKGTKASDNATCGWLRFYGITPGAKADATRRANAVKLVEFFGGKDNEGKYTMQKLLLLDLGLPFCTQPLAEDADVKAFWDKWAGVGGSAVIAKQASMAVKKDTISPWFSEWNETNNKVWQSIFLDKAAPEAGLKESAQKWADLKKASK